MPTLEEVKDVIFSMSHDSCPGPDVFLPSYIKNAGTLFGGVNENDLGFLQRKRNSQTIHSHSSDISS